MSQNLAPPVAPNRHRAHSTNLRPALTINTLGRRRSCSLGRGPETASPAPQSCGSSCSSSAITPVQTDLPVLSSEPDTPPTMFAVIASRCIQFLQLSPKHSLQWSTPSSPRSSTDEYVLPISASSYQTTFDDVHGEKEISTTRTPSAWWQGYSSIHAPILFVVILFPLSAAVILFCLSTLPIAMSWPRTITDVASLGTSLHDYSQSGHSSMAHVIGVMSVTVLWMHAWSIPGSVILNVLAGVLFHPVFATLLLTILTTIGSILATLLATPLAPLISRFFPRALDMTRTALEGDAELDTRVKSKSPAWVRLSVLRLVGVVPWSGINIASGVCGVAISDCILGSFIGTLPWTAVTCQIGDILQTVASAPSPTPQTVSSLLASPAIIMKLAFLSFLSLAPILGRDRLQALVSSGPSSEEQERQSRWTWVQDWRTKIRLSSRSRPRDESRQLEILIREKQEMSP